MSLVLAATTWPTNADLIADCARLGYLQRDWRTLDPTYGKGAWWTKWRPERLVTPEPPFDFRHMNKVPSNYFDAVAFDPPYVCIGGRRTSGLPGYHARYSMDETPKTPEGVQLNIDLGLSECARVCKPGGFVLVKCQDYVSSGKLWLGTHHTLSWALSLDLECQDRLEHVAARSRPQPNRPQQHARRNLSTLFVFRKPKRRPHAARP